MAKKEVNEYPSNVKDYKKKTQFPDMGATMDSMDKIVRDPCAVNTPYLTDYQTKVSGLYPDVPEASEKWKIK